MNQMVFYTSIPSVGHNRFPREDFHQFRAILDDMIVFHNDNDVLDQNVFWMVCDVMASIILDDFYNVFLSWRVERILSIEHALSILV